MDAATERRKSVKTKKVKVKIFCPYEIGDEVQFEKCGITNIMEVSDVITETSAKNGTTKFRLELDGWYMLDTSRHEVAVRGKKENEG